MARNTWWLSEKLVESLLLGWTGELRSVPYWIVEGVRHATHGTASSHLVTATHALDRMAPRGLIQRGNEIVSRGIPPSVVENAIKYGKVTEGNTASEVVRTYENVRVVTNPEGTRVITVITTGN